MAKIFNVIDGYFGEALKNSPSYEQAYERAIDKFIRVHGVECPMSYSSYRNKMWRERRKKK